MYILAYPYARITSCLLPRRNHSSFAVLDGVTREGLFIITSMARVLNGAVVAVALGN